MDIVSLALGLLSGGGGGLLAGKLMNSNMGTAARAITGIVGGVGPVSYTHLTLPTILLV